MFIFIFMTIEVSQDFLSNISLSFYKKNITNVIRALNGITTGQPDGVFLKPSEWF
jgi:hypothetical protein